MVRIFSFCVWLGACATSTLAGAQASRADNAAKAPACAVACAAPMASTCAQPNPQSGQRASSAPPAQAPGAQCEGFLLPSYTSAWTGYQPWRDDAVGDWRQANAVVARIGGWRAYARETAPIASTTTPAKAAP